MSWLMKAMEYKGSWWNYWLNWLIKNNDNKLVRFFRLSESRGY